MLKSASAVASVVAILAAAPAHAQSTTDSGAPTASGVAFECSQSAIDKLDARISDVTDKSRRNAAAAEMKAAGDLMRKNDFIGCTTHMSNAEKALGKS
jgi:hypothetical protein